MRILYFYTKRIDTKDNPYPRCFYEQLDQLAYTKRVYVTPDEIVDCKKYVGFNPEVVILLKSKAMKFPRNLEVLSGIKIYYTGDYHEKQEDYDNFAAHKLDGLIYNWENFLQNYIKMIGPYSDYSSFNLRHCIPNNFYYRGEKKDIDICMLGTVNDGDYLNRKKMLEKLKNAFQPYRFYLRFINKNKGSVLFSKKVPYKKYYNILARSKIFVGDGKLQGVVVCKHFEAMAANCILISGRLAEEEMLDIGLENEKNIFIANSENIIDVVLGLLNKYEDVKWNYFDETRKIWPMHTDYQRAVEFIRFCKMVKKRKESDGV